MNKIFLNSDVIRILEIPQRKIVGWAEKGLVIPLIDAKGAGSKRNYTYTNLLEFGLCKRLFSMGLEHYQVKKMLADFRESGQLRQWAESYENFLSAFATNIKKAFEFNSLEKVKDQAKEFGFDFGKIDDPAKITVGIIKKLIRPEKPIGTLLYSFTEKESVNHVYPTDIKHLFNGWLGRYLLERGVQGVDILLSEGTILINLGKIKEKVDIQLKKLGY